MTSRLLLEPLKTVFGASGWSAASWTMDPQPAPARLQRAGEVRGEKAPPEQVRIEGTTDETGGAVAIFNLTLQRTYFRMGFFNVGVSHDRYVRKTEGPVRLRLGREGGEIEARVDRHSNQNGTPRIMGGAQLKRWFQANFEPMDSVAVDLASQDVIVLDRQRVVPHC